MINIGTLELADAYIGSTPIEKVYLGSQLVWEKNEEYIAFIDNDVEYVCCVHYGQYIKSTISTVDNGDDTVTITTTNVLYNAAQVKNTTTLTETREKTAEDVIGTVTDYIMVGLTMKKAKEVFGETKASILNKLKFVYFTSSFDTTIPIYGLKSYNSTKKVDCFLNFNVNDTTNYVRINVYYQRYPFYNGKSNNYSAISSKWWKTLNNHYITMFKDSESVTCDIDILYFKSIDGSKPANWRSGLNEILVNEDDIT